MDEAQERWQDLTLSMDQLMRLAPRWTFYFAVVTLGPYLLLWGWPSLSLSGPLLYRIGAILSGTALFLLAYVLGAVLHEGLHAAAMVLFARVPFRVIHFRMRLREGIAYVHADVPMSARAYRGVLLLPGLLLGVLPALGGIAAGSGWLTFYGFIMLASAIGDVAVFRLIRPLPGDARVRDHPRDVGCQVFSSS